MVDQAGSGLDSGLGKGGGPTIKFSEPPTRPSDSNKTDSHTSRPHHLDLKRPTLDRSNTESSLPAHERQSVVNIPVTPGIASRTYSPESGRDASSPSYFHTHDPNDAVASLDPLDDNMAANDPDAVAGASMSGHDILRRMSKSSHGRRESINDMRAAYPSLPLSGNVISATFNIPHSVKYRKGADWVSAPEATKIWQPLSICLILTRLRHRNSNLVAANPPSSMPSPTCPLMRLPGITPRLPGPARSMRPPTFLRHLTLLL